LISLYHGTGSRGFEICDDALDQQQHESLMLNARQMLRARGKVLAAEYLENTSFRVCGGTNDFADEFHVLFATLPLQEYERFRSISARPEDRSAFSDIAEVLTEIGTYIRFIAVELRQVAPESWDVFICHASEDKVEVAEPLYRQLASVGIKCWYDEGEILWGDSIVEKINLGLKRSRFVVVILSLTLLSKRWATKELHAALSQEIESGTTQVLPLIVGSDDDVAQIQRDLAIQRDKRYLRWLGNPRDVENELRALLRRDNQKGTS